MLFIAFLYIAIANVAAVVGMLTSSRLTLILWLGLTVVCVLFTLSLAQVGDGIQSVSPFAFVAVSNVLGVAMQGLYVLLIGGTTEMGQPYSKMTGLPNKLLELGKIKRILSSSILLSFVLALYAIGPSNVLEVDWFALVSADVTFGSLALSVSQIIFCFGSALLYVLLVERANWWRIVGCCLVIIAYAMLLRVKTFLLPIVVLPMLFAISFRNTNIRVLIRRGMLLLPVFIVLYLGIKFVRWAGTYEDFQSKNSYDLIISVLDDSVERELLSSYLKVFEYFESNEGLYGASYTRIISKPIGELFDREAPENPIYLYSRITNPHLFTDAYLGSDHPTLYGDSFANFGWFGVVVCGLMCMALSSLERFLRGKAMLTCFIMGGLAVGVPLVVRGSVFFGLLIVLGVAVIACCMSFPMRIFRTKYFHQRSNTEPS